MIYYSKIVKIKMDYITKYQYVKLIHFLRRHHLYFHIIFLNRLLNLLCHYFENNVIDNGDIL